jgi:hypothetical protein
MLTSYIAECTCSQCHASLEMNYTTSRCLLYSTTTSRVACIQASGPSTTATLGHQQLAWMAK